MGVVFKMSYNSETKNLVELTENFINLLDSLYREGRITEAQFSEMTESKVDFIRSVRNTEIFLNT